MYEPPLGYEIVLSCRRRDESLDSQLVLDAANIFAETVHRDGTWFLLVRSDDIALAYTELQAYRQENSDESAPTRPAMVGALPGVFIYAACIVLVASLADRDAFGWDWLLIGRTHAGRIVAGEWWRTITALTLHSDLGHLGGNLIFGAVFGRLVGQALGGGVAWILIVSAAATGNFMNAIMRPANHTSIGASTAVFAALAVLVSHAFRPGAPTQASALRRWNPIIGGILLLAFIGVGGERTDVAAHVAGFVAGLVFGCLSWTLPDRWLAKPAVQGWAGLVTIVIIVSAWLVAQAVGHS
jgi:rhomboid protease GluP